MSGLVVAAAPPLLAVALATVAWAPVAGNAVYVITVRAVGRGVAVAPVATVAVTTAGATGTAVAGAGSAVAGAGSAGSVVATSVGNCSNTCVVAVASVATVALPSPGFWVNMVPAYQ